MKKNNVLFRVVAMIFSACLMLGSVAAFSDEASAANKPTMSKAVSLKVNEIKKISVKSNGFVIKKITAKSSAKKTVSVVNSTKSYFSIKGLKKGKANINISVKASKNKKTKLYKLTTKVSVTKADAVKKTVATQAELNAALKNAGLKKLVINQKAKKLDIPKGTYKDVELLVDAPNATITNKATFKSIEINDIAYDTWNEKGKKNSIHVSAKKAVHIVVDGEASIASVDFDENAGKESRGTPYRNIIEVKQGSVEKIKVDSKLPMDIKTEGDARINTILARNSSDVSAMSFDDSFLSFFKINGKVNAELSGTSKNKCILDLSESDDSSRVVVSNPSVQVETSENVSASDVIENQTGQDINVNVKRGDGKVGVTTVSSDGDKGIPTEEGFTVTLNLTETESVGATINTDDAEGFKSNGDGMWTKTYAPGESIGSIPIPTQNGSEFIIWGYMDKDRPAWRYDTVGSNLEFGAVWADSIMLELDYNGKGTNKLIENVTVDSATTLDVPETHGFLGWCSDDGKYVYPQGATIGDVVRRELYTEQVYSWQEVNEICKLRLFAVWDGNDDSGDDEDQGVSANIALYLSDGATIPAGQECGFENSKRKKELWVLWFDSVGKKTVGSVTFPTPVKEGSVFVGWRLYWDDFDETGTTDFDSILIKDLPEQHCFKPIWE